MTTLAPALQGFFTERLIAQRAASPNTIANYRQTFRLLLTFASTRRATTPSQLAVTDLDAPMVSAFLSHLERDRGNSPATRNNRLAAIHSLFGYIALTQPEHAATAQRVLAIPTKQAERTIVTYLTEHEANALLAACDQRTWTSRRDHAMFALAMQAGLRISELAALTRQDITLTTGANVHTIGKGRKERRTPLVPVTKAVLKAWLAERPGAPGDPLFPTTTGRHLSRDAIERRLARAVTTAATTCPSLRTKHVTMHTLRHTAAMRLLEAGNDITVIALWLGHEQLATTNIYLHADMALKQQAIDKANPPAATPGRYQPPDPLLAFLEAL
ncbi:MULTISPECIES: tyrosine-type recombinase/integrase [unclassified Pseudofrankia]|uniref:tyrosine-type recombinase/integrase n=1 Tax=unclassified Pseudofrankia TaxID=2994372 RepID=UPI0008D917EA|nr:MULTISPECIES: tyrosine-type recombinase/integrase [unclassified Pseudofrankia]MDT3445158.1 tyrosine-type recombinase/integrase [Pseudofrankia sp. BMG5.37]OHV63225.1 integrase [Pseudofrankia sp. BMG5.36]